MSKSTIWLRVGRWLRPGLHTVGGHEDSNGVGLGVADSVAARRGWWGRLLPLGESSIASDGAVHTGAGVVHRLSAGSHVAARGQGVEELARTIDRLSGSVSALPQVTKQQSEVLRTLAGRMEIQAGNLRKLEETLAQVPRMADAHRETMVSVSRKLDSLRETTDRGATVVNSLQRTLDRIDDSSGRVHEAVRELNAKMSAREARTAALLIDHSRRVMVMGAIGLFLATVAAAAGTLTLVLR